MIDLVSSRRHGRAYETALSLRDTFAVRAVPTDEDLERIVDALDLELVDPNGDLIWISSRGLNGPSFSAANDAVEASLQPMLKLLEKTTKNSGAASQPASH